MSNENISRLEQYLQAIGEGTGGEGLPVPQSRLEEIFLAIATGDDSHCPQPQSRLEAYALACVGAGGGGTATPLQEKSITITENGTTEVLPDEGYALSKVTATAQVYDGGVDERARKIVDRSITEFSDDSITSIGSNAFNSCKALTSVNFPNVTSINSNAFYGCIALTSADFPNVTSIGIEAFGSCSALTSVSFPNATSISMEVFKGCKALTSADFPNITSIPNYAFDGCSALTSADFPNITGIGSYAFDGCKALTSVDFPNVTSIPNYAFGGCIALTSVNFPNVTSINNSAFNNCSALTSVNFPNATSINNNAFGSCSALISADFPNVTSIGTNAFSSCVRITTLILRSDSICTLGSTSVFYNCYHIHGTKNTTYNPNGDKDGYFYVPKALLSDDDETKDYRRATNWSTFADRFRALEDYTVDGTITGELDWDKINAANANAGEVTE